MSLIHLVNSIPIVICAIAAKQVSGLDEVGVVGGIVAGILAVDGGILGGLIIGILAGVLAYYISVFCFRHNVPGTTVNIASGGLGGLAAGSGGKIPYCTCSIMDWKWYLFSDQSCVLITMPSLQGR